MAVIVLSMSFALSKQGLGSTPLRTVNRQNLAFAVHSCIQTTKTESTQHRCFDV